MIKVIEIRKAVTTYLKTIHPRLYYQVAPDNAQKPYLVYDLPNSIDDGSMERFVLEIDGWDSPENDDTTALETLMGNIDGDGDKLNPSGLNRKTITVNELGMIFYRENRLSPLDDDKRIRRRKYVYQIRTFVGG